MRIPLSFTNLDIKAVCKNMKNNAASLTNFCFVLENLVIFFLKTMLFILFYKRYIAIINELINSFEILGFNA